MPVDADEGAQDEALEEVDGEICGPEAPDACASSWPEVIRKRRWQTSPVSRVRAGIRP